VPSGASPGGRVALTLRLIACLTTAEIARGFLVAEPTIAQRNVRAKRTLAQAGVPFEVPGPAERVDRLGSVLEVVYLVFNEGYSATAGDDWMRPTLCAEALRLGRVLAGLMPDEAEVRLGFPDEIQASRLRARTEPSGEPVLLLDQDRQPTGHESRRFTPGWPRLRRRLSSSSTARSRSRWPWVPPPVSSSSTSSSALPP